MTSFLIFFILLILLFLLSSWNKQLSGQFLLHLVRSKPVVISLLSLFLYPGTVVHELSHLVIAAITFTPVKGMKLTPEIIDDNKIRAGSVTIAQVDIFRRTIIGIAPLFVGLTALWAITIYLLPPLPFFSSLFPLSAPHVFILNAQHSILNTFLAFYFLFSISASMFASRKDLEALIVFVPVMIVFGIIAYIVGFLGQRPIVLWTKISWLTVLLEHMSGVFEVLNSVLILPLIIHLFLLILLFLLKRI